jgi:hypothetical protein
MIGLLYAFPLPVLVSLWKNITPQESKAKPYSSE